MPMKATKPKVETETTLVKLHTSLPETLKNAITQKVAREMIVRKKKVTVNQFIVEVLEKAVQ